MDYPDNAEADLWNWMNTVELSCLILEKHHLKNKLPNLGSITEILKRISFFKICS
jgi:hypothetical protein